MLALLAFLAVTGFGRDALANSYSFCLSMDTDYENVGFGEDYIVGAAGPYTARYIKVKVTKGAEVIVDTTYANQSGCVSFTHGTTGQFKLEVWGEMRIPRTDNAANNNTVRILNSSGNQPYWNYFWTFGATSGSKSFTLPQSNRTNLINISRWAYERHSDGLIAKVTEVHDRGDGCDGFNNCNGDCSCNGFYAPLSQLATVYINSIHNKRKFLIGHELGHAFLAHWFGDNPAPVANGGQGSTYSRNEGGASCQWSGAGAHAIHLKEYSSGALLEGYPHYFATYLFNSEASTVGAFWYYKDGTGVTNVDMESGSTGGATLYMEATCSGSDALRGVELDWARAFWNFKTEAGTKPSNYALTRQIKNGLTDPGWDMEDAWAKTQIGMDIYDSDNGTSFATRWDTKAAQNGIDH